MSERFTLSDPIVDTRPEKVARIATKLDAYKATKVARRSVTWSRLVKAAA